MSGWGSVAAGYLLVGLVWAGYALWSRTPAKGRR